MRGAERIAVALDLEDLDEADALASRLVGEVGWFKVGLELFSAHGHEAVRRIRRHGPVFLDVKLHDIPTTVERATRRLATLDVGLVTVHATGGREMLRAAVEALGDRGRVLAVTVLTSISQEDLAELRLLPDPDRVEHLASVARDAGAGGVVCAPAQAAAVRAVVGTEALVVTPGVRPAGAGDDDHAGVATPRQAREAGADLVVVGRPVTRADDPVEAARAIAAELDDPADGAGGPAGGGSQGDLSTP